MPATYEPISTVTLSSAAAQINFTGIPNTYTDLRVCVVAFTASGYNTAVWYRFNSDTGSNYSSTILSANGSSATSQRYTNDTKIIQYVRRRLVFIGYTPG